MDVLERYQRMGFGAGTLAMVTAVIEPVESGDITITSATWGNIGPQKSINAQAGDTIEITPSFLGGNGADIECDLAIIVGGSRVRYLSSRTSVQKTNGYGPWYLRSGNEVLGLPACIVLQSGDISNGQVTFQVIGKSVGVDRTLFANNATYAGQLTLKNLNR